MKQALYPLKFKPILKERIWGGIKLKTELNKDSDLNHIGESWELSDVEGDVSVISNGALKGKTLKECINTYQQLLLGVKNFERFGNRFPLLIKFIDAKKDLSIQLHPGDELAAERHGSFGKTEMWYVMQTDDEANLIVGFKQNITPDIYLKHLKNKTLTQILNFDEVKSGDTYFIEAGRVHAIGAGVLLAEIQQTSDVTYRVYDWDRTDEHGAYRELHNDLALDAIDFNMENNFRVHYKREKNQSNEMVNCPYFVTNYIPLKGSMHKINTKDSFIIYMCVEGVCKLKMNEYTIAFSKGETVLVPAVCSDFELRAEQAKLLEVYI